MPALRKPHRVAFLLPSVTITGSDVGIAHEVALVLWAACIEACQHHPGLAVYDAESTPLFPQDAHFTPQHAVIGATPTDPFYASTRRDELLWLELALPKHQDAKLHALRRDGVRDSFTASGANLGEQINNLFTAWLAARGLAPLVRRHPSHEAVDLIATVKPIAPILVEQARAWALPTAPTWSLVIDGGVDDSAPEVEDANADLSLEIEIDAVDGEPPKPVAKSSLGRPAANKLPQNPLKLAALRVLQLALREDLDDLILAVDPEQPQALFARFREEGARDFALLRRVIAAAPCWAKPYAELDRATSSELEIVAGAGIAALCRPQHLDVIERVASLLETSGLVDEGIRLLDRAQIAMHDQSRAHLALLGLYPLTGRVGAWLAQASRSARVHGCPMDIHLPWYPDQIQVDLCVADALMNVGRLDEAIALRANRLEGRESTWPRHTRILTRWRKDPRFVAWCYALEGYFRGDPARTVEGFGRIQPGDDVDVAALLDALVATGREDEVALAWAEFGLGRDHTGPVARLAAARALLSAGEWRRGMEEMWHVELGEPGRDEHVAMARCGQLLSCAPLDVAEAALGERVAIGATSIARRMARDVADFIPGAAKSSVVTRALGKVTPIEIDPASMAGFSPDTRSKKAIDKFFEAISVKRDKGDDGSDDTKLIQHADKLVARWLEITYTDAGEDDPRGLAQAATYMAAQALARYLAATTMPASPITGALRTIAAESLALVRVHREHVTDRDARALLRMVEPLLRRVDRWIGSAWLGTVERSLGIDERAAGDVAGFARDQATIAARVLGPEESAVLAASIARLHREQPKNWAAAVVAQATQLALHTGYLGAEEWADAIVAQLAAKEIELDDAIDELHTTCYLTQGLSAKPAMHAARVLLEARRGPAAIAVLVAGLPAAEPAWRDKEIATLAEAWAKLSIDIPFDFAKVATQMYEALQKGEPARAEKLGRWAVAFDPTNAEAHRNLGLALAQQGKITDALVHLVRATPDQATQILSGILYQAGKLPDAMSVLDYASRWYVRADQWLTYGGIAYAAMDNPRTVHAYALAYKLDPDAFDATQLNAYAGVLDEVGDYDTCEKIAKHLVRAAGDDVMWLTNAWNHLACARIGQGKFDEAEKLAADAVEKNPLPDNAENFAATLERAKKKQKTTPPQATPPGKQRDPIYAHIDASDLTAAASSPDKDKSWRVKRAAIEAVRFRFSSENAVAVTPRARAAASAVLAETAQYRDRDVCIARCTAMQIREQAAFARDPIPTLGDRMTREAFYQEFRARGGVVIGEDAPPPPPFKDRVVIAGSPIARASDYIALLRDLAAIDPREAIKQFDLDEASYLEVARQWTAAMEADPSIAQTIAAGLAKR
jgi:tetratricopeptide (TPR) repeat protein